MIITVVGGSGRRGCGPHPRASSTRSWMMAQTLSGSPATTSTQALAAAAGADVVVACGGAATTEAADRDSLRLDNHDFLTALVAGVDAPVVLVALAPGAVVLPQADAAAAALVCFLCGEATGLALADVLLGRKEPWRRGRLPVTIYIPVEARPRLYSNGTALRGRRLPVHRGRARRLPRY